MITCAQSVPMRIAKTVAIVAICASAGLAVSTANAEQVSGQARKETKAKDTGRLSQFLIGNWIVNVRRAWSPPQKVGANAEKKKRQATGKTQKPDAEKDLFRPDPTYDKDYSAKEQVDIYGGKVAVDPPRPLIELGRQQYTSGLYDPSNTFLGQKNPLLPGLAIYGDWRTAVAFNKNNGKEIAQVATRLNLDVDLKITGTERKHAFFTPIQRGGKFTRFEFAGRDGDGQLSDELDFNPQTLFFEGDLGSLYAGFSSKEASFDLPFTIGLFPLFLQNGVWANDAILGGAFALPARNSPLLGLSNYDLTFFAAFDNVDNAGLVGADGEVDNNTANLYGVTTFVDAFDGYVEAGYGIIPKSEIIDPYEPNPSYRLR